MAPGEAHLVAFSVPAVVVVAVAYIINSWEVALGGLAGCAVGALTAPVLLAEFEPGATFMDRFLVFTFVDLAWTVPSSAAGALVGTVVMLLRRRGRRHDNVGGDGSTE